MYVHRVKIELPENISRWFKILYWLQDHLLINYILKKYRTKHDNLIINLWIFFSLIFASIAISISTKPEIAFWEWILIIIAFLRILAILIQLTYMLFIPCYMQDIAHSLTGIPRTIVIILLNYVEILLYFAIFYRNFHYYFYVQNGSFTLNSISGSTYFSLITMSTLGYGDVTPIYWQGMLLTLVQTLIGLYLLLIVLAYFISIIPRTKTVDEHVAEIIDNKGNIIS